MIIGIDFWGLMILRVDEERERPVSHGGMRSNFDARVAAAVYLQPMTAHLEAGRSRGGTQGFLNVAVREIGRRAAYSAEHVVVVSLVAELVTEFAVFQKNTANLAGIYEEAEAAEHGGPAYARESDTEVLGGKGPVLGGDGADYQATGFGIAIAEAGQAFDDIIHDCGGTRLRMVVSRMFVA